MEPPIDVADLLGAHKVNGAADPLYAGAAMPSIFLRQGPDADQQELLKAISQFQKETHHAAPEKPFTLSPVVNHPRISQMIDEIEKLLNSPPEPAAGSQVATPTVMEEGTAAGPRSNAPH